MGETVAIGYDPKDPSKVISFKLKVEEGDEKPAWEPIRNEDKRDMRDPQKIGKALMRKRNARP